MPLQVTFRQMDPSDAVQEAIRKRSDKLVQFYDRIVSCRVVVHAPHRHHHKGKLYSISVDVKVPDGDVAVHRDAVERHAHEDIYVAIRDAFDAAERQLDELIHRRRGEVKARERGGRESDIEA